MPGGTGHSIRHITLSYGHTGNGKFTGPDKVPQATGSLEQTGHEKFTGPDTVPLATGSLEPFSLSTGLTDHVSDIVSTESSNLTDTGKTLSTGLSDPVQSTGTVVNERNLFQTFNSGLSNVVNGLNVNLNDNSEHISTAERYDALLRDTQDLTGIQGRGISMINSDNIQSLNQTVTTDNMMDKRFNDLLKTIQQSSIQREQNMTDSLKNFMNNRFKEFEQEYHYDSEYTETEPTDNRFTQGIQFGSEADEVGNGNIDNENTDSESEQLTDTRSIKFEGYKRSLRRIFIQFPQSQGEQRVIPNNVTAANAMRIGNKVVSNKSYRLNPAPSLVANFDSHHRRLFDSGAKTPTNEDTPGSQAFTSKNKFLLPQGSFKRKLSDTIQGNPLKLVLDESPCPKICKTDPKLLDKNAHNAISMWTDKLCGELNHCEWAQLTSIKLLASISDKTADNPELKGIMSDLNVVIDLLGENLNKAEVSASAIKTNLVLEQRDHFIAHILPDVPTKLTNLARIQPIFNHPTLIGEPVERMAKALEVTQTQLAVKAMANVTRQVATAVMPRGRGKPSFARGRGHNRGRGSYVTQNFSPPRGEYDRSERGSHRGRSSFRGSRSYRGGRGNRGRKPDPSKDRKQS